jgi:hypothetical protein
MSWQVLDTINVVTMILALLAVTVWKEELKETQSDRTRLSSQIMNLSES